MFLRVEHSYLKGQRQVTTLKKIHHKKSTKYFLIYICNPIRDTYAFLIRFQRITNNTILLSQLGSKSLKFLGTKGICSNKGGIQANTSKSILRVKLVDIASARVEDVQIYTMLGLAPQGYTHPAYTLLGTKAAYPTSLA